MDIGVVIAIAFFGFASLLAVLMGVIAAVSAIAGIIGSAQQEED